MDKLEASLREQPASQLSITTPGHPLLGVSPGQIQPNLPPSVSLQFHPDSSDEGSGHDSSHGHYLSTRPSFRPYTIVWVVRVVDYAV